MARYVQRQSFFVQGKAFCTQCHTLIKADMITDYSRLPDHNTRTMIDTEIFSDLRSRMNVYSCIRMGISVIIRGITGTPSFSNSCATR